jgi:hypothetical protein
MGVVESWREGGSVRGDQADPQVLLTSAMPSAENIGDAVDLQVLDMIGESEHDDVAGRDLFSAHRERRHLARPDAGRARR